MMSIVPRDEQEEDIENEAKEDPFWTTFEEMVKEMGHLDNNHVFGFSDIAGPWNE